MTDPATPSDRLANGTFAPGNPGKAKGTRWKQSRAAEQLLEGESEALTRKAIEMAKAGDTTALRLCLERLVPARKDRTIEFELPSVKTAADHPIALGAILTGVATGEITPAEAHALSGVLEQHRRALETADIDERLRAIEERQNG